MAEQSSGMANQQRSHSLCPKIGRSVFSFLTVTFWSATTWAQDAPAAPTGAAAGGGLTVVLCWLVAAAGSIIALVFAFKFYNWMKEQDEGDARMVEIAGHVRDGANAYLWRQYRIVFLFFVVTSVLLAIVAFVFDAQSGLVPFAFLTGGFFSGLAGWFGMKTATWASSRTAQACKQSLNAGLQVAFRSGAVMGLTVVGLGLLDICLWFAVLYWVAPMFGHTFSLEEITVTMLLRHGGE